MKKRTLVMTSLSTIAVLSIGGYAFAKGADFKGFNSNQGKVVIEEPVEYKSSNNQQKATPQESTTQESEKTRNYSNHCGNNEEMTQIMRENGFEDMAKWMEEGNFKAMDEYMNNMSDEDYDKMVDLMKENGYGGMTSMMESIGREGMINMHNSMMGGRGSKPNMMGNMMGRLK